MYLDSNFGGLGPSQTPDRRSARRELADIIDRALAALDALDGDPDLEPSGDELDASFLEPGCHVALPWALPYEDAEDDDSLEQTALGDVRQGLFPSGPDDIEDGNDAEHDTADFEPSLAAPEADSLLCSQIAWSRGGDDDLEWERI